MVVDDYGHHPNEIAAVLRAAKDHTSRRVVVLFQPHRYTRTRDLLAEFGTCFRDADRVVVAPIYAAGEDPVPGVDAEGVVREIQAHGHPDCAAAASLDDLPAIVRPTLREGDLVLTLGAGNIHQAGEALLLELAAHGVGARA